MSTIQEDTKRWIKEGKKQKAAYLLIVCDRFNYENYPVYVKKNESLEEKKNQYSIHMQSIDDIIDLRKKKS